MFNLLVSCDESAWESPQRLRMMTSRFLEHSGDECEGISAGDPKSLKRLESVQTLLMYEDILTAPPADVVRVGQVRDVRVNGGDVTFRFAERGRIDRQVILLNRARLQLGRFESSRTHWAVKDGEVPQDILESITPTQPAYDVVLSFAGEDREYVERVATELDAHGVNVFYDKNERVTLWGKDLSEHLDTVYRKLGRYCVMFISAHYAIKMWTTHERRSAFARALTERSEYILPVRFDATDIPGLPPTVGYIDISQVDPSELATLIREKLGRA